MNIDLLDFQFITAELCLLLSGFLILGLDLFAKKDKQYNFAYLSIIFHLVAIFWLIYNFNLEGKAFYDLVLIDKWSNFIKILLLVGSLICIFISPKFLKNYSANYAEFYFLIHVILVSCLFLVSSSNLLFIYLSLETASITSLVLCSINKHNKFSTEATMKYFLLNAFSSAILLYGITLIFGTSGTFELAAMQQIFINQQSIQITTELGVFLLVVGFGFKIALVPFHMWAPDLYEGSLLNITAFFATPLKIAYVATLAKICILALISYSHIWTVLLSLMAALSFIIGNLLALVQNKIKRVLAYSSISHSGFLILGILSFSVDGLSSLIFYFVVYTFASLGVFASIIYLTGKKDEVCFDDLKGCAFTHPIMSGLLIFALLSLAGIPITGGFIGKLYLFYNGLNSGLLILVILGILGSVISVGYYLKFSVKLFTKVEKPVESNNIRSLTIGSIILVCCFVLIALGVLPSLLDGIISTIKLA